MRKLILFAAMAAVTDPAAASAQRHDEMRRDQVRHDQHDRSNRHGDRTIGTPFTSPPTGVGTTAR